MEDELISIIIPIFNAERYLEKCLESVMNQTYKSLEIILVNDGSTDSSEKICLKEMQNDNRIKYYKCENSGVSHARNYGIKNSNGKYITFIDSDDFIDKLYIEKMYKILVKEKSDISFSNYILYNSEKNNIIEKNVEFKDCSSFIEFLFKNKETSIWTKLIKKECISILLDENISIAEDMLFWTNNAINIKKYSYTNEYLYYYNIHNGSLMHQKNIKVSEKEISELIAFEQATKIVPCDLKYLFQFEYVNSFLKLKACISKDNKKQLNKYVGSFKKYIKEILKSTNINNKEKIKIIMKHRLFYLYRLFKIKLKKETY